MQWQFYALLTIFRQIKCYFYKKILRNGENGVKLNPEFKP